MATFESLLQRFEACVQRLEAVPSPATMALAPASDGPASPAVQAYRAYRADQVEPFLTTCDKIGGDIARIVRRRGVRDWTPDTA